jgi:predicted Rossmann fold flavoprotein
MTQVRVVGAGPAGLMAAEILASTGLSVTIVDHHKHPARKFLLAGRGGLNLTHSEPLAYFLKRYSSGREWLEPAIRVFPPDALRAWCHGLGIETFVGSSSRVFPKGMRASPLLRAWLRRLQSLGVTLQSQSPWTGFDDIPTILALGGASWPELGSDAAWVKIFESAGVGVNPLQPSNGRQLMTWSDHFSSRFAGTPLKNVDVTVAGRTVRGEVMITRDGIEGGAVYSLSPQFRTSSIMLIDLKPDMSAAVLSERMAFPQGKQSRSNYWRKVAGLSPIAISLMREASSENPKHVTITTKGPAAISRAISTAGGVAASEFDEHFRLRKFPNTFVVGEMLDWDAPTGGYLLQACFSTAYVAAKAMASALKTSTVNGTACECLL